MKKLFSLIAVVLCASGTLAQAQTASTNPFARPAPPSATPGTPGTPGAPGSPGARPQPLSANGGAPMSAQPTPGAPGMFPPGQPGQPGQAGAYPPPPGVYQPSGGMPGMPGMPGAPMAAGPETTEEEVSASRIGKVNGMHIYRGQNTYMFESSKNRKVVRRLIPTTASAMTPPGAAAKPAEKTPNLPSMVGRPAPTN